MLLLISINNFKFKIAILLLNFLLIALGVTSSSTQKTFDLDTFLDNIGVGIGSIVAYVFCFSLIVGFLARHF